ncbi:MAG: hypothetical protein QHC90_13280 [Shinella sp.]|nr:hypothetical protein [Shinella sp.]
MTIETSAPPDPEKVVAWLDRKIWSSGEWMKDHGPRAKKPRPDWDIEFHREDMVMLTYIRASFLRAVEKRNAAA